MDFKLLFFFQVSCIHCDESYNADEYERHMLQHYRPALIEMIGNVFRLNSIPQRNDFNVTFIHLPRFIIKSVPSYRSSKILSGCCNDNRFNEAQEIPKTFS